MIPSRLSSFLGLALCIIVIPALGSAPGERGAGDIRVSPDTLRFGPILPGESQSQTLLVANDGFGVLTIGEIAVNLAEIELGGHTPEIPPGTEIEPSDDRTLTVTFLANSPGTLVGTLMVPSNDPDEPEVAVVIETETLVPPIVRVTPASFDESIDTGQVETRDLVIHNDGATALDWTVAVLPGSGLRRGGDLAGIQILWDRTHGQQGTTGWATIVDSLTARGATVTVVTAGSITPEVLANYQVYWTIDAGLPWQAVERDAVAGWVSNGGALLVMGDNLQSIGRFNELLAAVGAGVEYSSSAAEDNVVTTAIDVHPVTEGISRIFVGLNARTLTNLVSPAVSLVRDVGGIEIAAASTVGAGRLIALSDELFDDVAIQEAQAAAAQNLEFGLQCVDWLAGELWLSADPTTGSTAAAASSSVTLTFDATGLGGGAFDLNVRVSSNDPLTPEVIVPAQLTVTGAPEIRVQPASIDFGPVPVGTVGIDTVTVFNDGFETLSVTGITSTDARFVAAPTNFAVPAQDSGLVVVSYSPDSTGVRTATFTIASNDADESSLDVLARGDGQVNCGLPCPASFVRPRDIQGSQGSIFALEIELDGNPDPISSFGLTLEYDPCFLEFADSSAVGSLTQDFSFISAQENEPGRITLGGFGLTPIPTSASGTVARVFFEVALQSCAADSSFDFVVGGFTDDIALMNPCCARFDLTECPTGNGDVNGDLALSPQDALCALKIFLNSQNVPADPDCDVNGECEVQAADTDCNGQVTPGDALAIFERYQLGDGPQPCFAQGARRSPGGLAWGGIAQDGVEVSAVLRASAGTRAAGIDLTFDPGALEFVGAHATTAWGDAEFFEFRLLEPGRVRGAFVSTVDNPGGSDVARLHFRALDTGATLRLGEAFDAVLEGPAELVVAGTGSPRIEFVRPLPSAAPLTIGYASSVPGGEIRIVDIAGRRVRKFDRLAIGRGELVWDGRDDRGRVVAPGVYFARLKAGETRSTKRIVLVR